MKKMAFLFTFILSLNLLLVSPVHAANCPGTDEDGDGWVATMHDGYKLYTGANWGEECEMAGTGMKKKVGDCVDMKPVDERNPAKMIKDKDGNQIKSKSINPDATDMPGNGIDENCDGQDGSYTPNTSTTADDVMNNIRSFLTWVVGGISGIVLIIGGIMYAMAAGDEQKTKKARKTMIGAIIGLVVAVLANVIISIIVQNIAG